VILRTDVEVFDVRGNSKGSKSSGGNGRLFNDSISIAGIEAGTEARAIDAGNDLGDFGAAVVGVIFKGENDTFASGSLGERRKSGNKAVELLGERRITTPAMVRRSGADNRDTKRMAAGTDEAEEGVGALSRTIGDVGIAPGGFKSKAGGLSSAADGTEECRILLSSGEAKGETLDAKSMGTLNGSKGIVPGAEGMLNDAESHCTVFLTRSMTKRSRRAWRREDCQ
jgi:hypothetical protein